MAAVILEERGYFWWHSTPVPDTHFAPEDSVTGLLRIGEDGRVELELDGNLPSDKHPFERLAEGRGSVIEGACIQGRLKTSDNHVLLTSLLNNGTRVSTHGISYESYLALGCLVGTVSFAAYSHPGKFKKLTVHLDGLEEWLRLGEIECSKSRSIKVKYQAPPAMSYPIADGRLRIEYDILAPVLSMKRLHEVTLKQRASLIYSPRVRVSLEDMKKQFCLIEDLLILLTGSDYCLDFPLISAGSDRAACRYYFLRHRSGAKPPAFHECWTSFPQLRDNFGAIFDTWLSQRQRYGPGFYLYLGTRRGIKLYPEHRFVNVLWGLESLHRSQQPATTAPSPLADKVQRILARIDDPKDKRWLARQLRNAHEPSLEQRLAEIIRALPVRFEEGRLREFSKTCAGMRNDLSHFGGRRDAGDYGEFLRKLELYSFVVSHLYALRILQEIGVDRVLLEHWIQHGYQSFGVRRNLVEVGLLPADALK